MGESAVSHRLEHHIDVAGVVEVAMAQHDCVERRQVDSSLGVVDDGARAGVQADPRAVLLDEEAAGRRNLPGDHETRPGGAHERELQVSATSDRGTSDFSPK